MLQIPRLWTLSCQVSNITIIDGTPIETTESQSEKYIYDPGDVETGEELTSDDVGLNCINQTPSTHLFVIRCVPSQPAEKNDWRKGATFHTSAKIRDKNCKVIVDSGSSIDAISSKSLENLGLEVIPTPTHSRCHGLTPRHLKSLEWNLTKRCIFHFIVFWVFLDFGLF